MTARGSIVLWFRALIIVCLFVIALSTTFRPEQGMGDRLLDVLPSVAALVIGLVALVGVTTLEGRPALRPLVGSAWVVVAGLVGLGMVAASLDEGLDPERLAFLLLGVVVATARNLTTGGFAGLMAAAAYVYLAAVHRQGAPTDPLVLTIAALFLTMGCFAGFLSQEVDWERQAHAARTAELRQELADLGEHLKNVLSCVASGVLVVDAEGRPTTYNRAAEAILGVSGHTVLGRPLGETQLAPLAALLSSSPPGSPEAPGSPAPDAPDPAFEGLNARQREGDDAGTPALRRDLTFERPDGRAIRIGYAATALEDMAGRRLGTILVFQDVTLIRDYEMRMLRQEQLAALGRTVSGIAHEFGNILGGAKGLLDLALQEEPADAVTSLPTVRDTLTRALSTVDHLLKFARGSPLDLTPGVSPDAVLERALHLLRPELEHRGLEVERRLASLPGLTADATQLEQVFINLLLNGIHAVNGRDDRRLRVSGGLQGGLVAICFEDSGSGVPPELRERVFEPFFTTKGALGGSEVPGTGLGLAMVHGVIEAHRGTVEVGASEDLRGAAFTIRLAPTESPAHGAQTTQRQKVSERLRPGANAG